MYNLKKIRLHIGHWRLDRRFLKISLPKLTSEEKKLLKETWPCVSISHFDHTCIRVYKKFNGFSPYYLAPMWYNEIRAVVNPQKQLQALENKAMCDIYFPQLNFPESYVRKINGVFYDREMNILSEENVIKILSQKEGFVIKPSIDSEQGKGVKIVKTKDESVICKIINESDNNFIAQEIIKQHSIISGLNESSLNTFRVTSLYLNGKYNAVTSLKVGKKGSDRDNWDCSYWINVEKDGILSEKGYDYNINVVNKTDNGIAFSGLKMPMYDEMIRFVERNHKLLFPNCCVVGWDITIDITDNIRVIEVNLDTPGTKIEQLCNGDFFKMFRDDICILMKK